MKLRSASIAGVLAAIGATAAAGGLIAPGGIVQAWDSHYTDNAYVRGDITQISPKVSGYIVDVPVRDNQQVAAGDILFRIDDRDYRARLAQTQAALATRRAAIGNLDAQISLQRAVIRQADAAAGEATTEAARSARDAVRAEKLAGEQLIAASQFDQLASSAQVAAARVTEMLANSAAARQRIAVLESQRPQLRADILAAEATVTLAELDVESTVVRAPVGGRVSERAARVGQFVKTGAQLIALVPRELWVVANFKETQLKGMQAGDTVEIGIDAVPGATFHGRLDSLSPASGAQFALLPPDNATGNFTRVVQRVPVRIALLDNQSQLDHLRPGMSATARVDIDASRRIPATTSSATSIEVSR
ncbi:HlyD family secretion protein [Lysobacter solisilvae (ex Woo and Kim 2020)]|uniref:HlyD family secretion protein n=1 Tax=Agrilutibacter terrestris TaxID=2865112 RepID=A0A7H0FXM4_9GAMM|nr:HlyD family secretion protein [Lysobacter terrestris]QNP40790.1 HlyD family secretion protein [Lysobacter terrestris]